MQPKLYSYVLYIMIFQSTHPLRDATYNDTVLIWRNYNFNPRTPYGMRLPDCSSIIPVISISIHAPLTGCDEAHTISSPPLPNFNPRTPYGMRHQLFIAVVKVTKDFNPRTPYGMRQAHITC